MSFASNLSHSMRLSRGSKSDGKPDLSSTAKRLNSSSCSGTERRALCRSISFRRKRRNQRPTTARSVCYQKLRGPLSSKAGTKCVSRGSQWEWWSRKLLEICRSGWRWTWSASRTRLVRKTDASSMGWRRRRSLLITSLITKTWKWKGTGHPSKLLLLPASKGQNSSRRRRRLPARGRREWRKR